MKKFLLLAVVGLTAGFSSVAQEEPIRRVVIEESTGTWCPWCVRGIVGVGAITESEPNVIPIAVHNEDPMANYPWDNAMAGYRSALGQGFPSAFADRTLLTSGELESDFVAAYNNRIASKAPAHVSVVASIDPGSREMTVTVNANFVEAVTDKYRLNAFIVEDNVSGNSFGYNQANAYAGGAYGPMGGFEDMPSTIAASNIVYDHVGREMLGGAWGVDGSIPENITPGEDYSYTFTHTLSEDYKVDDIHIVGLLSKFGSSPSNFGAREIVNSNITGLYFVDIAEEEAKIGLNMYPNPATDLVSVQFDLLKNEDVSIKLYNNLGQLVLTQNQGTMERGIKTLAINTSELSTGLYHVNLNIGDKLFSKKISVVK